MFKTKNHSEFIQVFKKKRRDTNEYEFLSEYISSNNPIKVKHKNCGNEFTTTPSSMVRSRFPKQCPYCSKTKIKNSTEDRIKKEVAVIGNHQFDFIKCSYENGMHKLTLLHKTCGGELDVYRNNMNTIGLRCPVCHKNVRNKITKKKRKKIKMKVEEVSRGKYTLLTDYQGYNEVVEVFDKEKSVHKVITFSKLMKDIKNSYETQEAFNQSLQSWVKVYIQKESNGRFSLKSDYKGYDKTIEVFDHHLQKNIQLKYASLNLKIKKIQLMNTLDAELEAD